MPFVKKTIAKLDNGVSFVSSQLNFSLVSKGENIDILGKSAAKLKSDSIEGIKSY